jgi:hypothetical protein
MENITVHHSTYGRGQIILQSEKTLRVHFEAEGIGDKSFVYPDAFACYLRYEDSGLQREIEAHLEAIRAEKAAQAAEREAERIRALEKAKKQQKELASARKKTAKRKVG